MRAARRRGGAGRAGAAWRGCGVGGGSEGRVGAAAQEAVRRCAGVVWYGGDSEKRKASPRAVIGAAACAWVGGGCLSISKLERAARRHPFRREGWKEEGRGKGGDARRRSSDSEGARPFTVVSVLDLKCSYRPPTSTSPPALPTVAFPPRRRSPAASTQPRRRQSRPRASRGSARRRRGARRGLPR